MKMLIIAGLLLAAATDSSAAGQATYYRWKDANGATHYSDTPPPSGKAQGVTVHQRQPQAPAPAPTPATAGSHAALGAAETAAMARNCANARQNLGVLDGKAMLVDSTDPQNSRRLSAEQVADARKRAQQDVDTFCGKGAK
jgi:hypothetical protein